MFDKHRLYAVAKKITMKKLIMVKGLPGCGKSTWARARMDENKGAYKRVNKDDLRLMLDNNAWSKSNEKFLLKVRDFVIAEALSAGKHVICDDTNLHEKHEKRLHEIAKEHSAMFQIHDMTDVPLDSCIERDLQRPKSVGEKVIRSMWKQYLKPKVEKTVAAAVHNQSRELPRAIICDLDGTLAKMHHRNPFDASKCDEDEVNEPVRNIVASFYAQGYKILFFTGREHKFKRPTLTFLEKAFPNPIEYDLYMRKTGDFRKDSIIKDELFRDVAEGKYYVEFILDDRNQVVDMWRELGLVCLQVDYGDF